MTRHDEQRQFAADVERVAEQLVRDGLAATPYEALDRAQRIVQEQRRQRARQRLPEPTDPRSCAW